MKEKGRPLSSNVELLAVPTERLAELLVRAKKKFEEVYPSREIHVIGEDHEFIGFFEWLSFESEIPEKRLRIINSKETKFTKLSVADAICNALNFDLNLLPIVPNPAMSQERWFAYLDQIGCSPDDLGVEVES